MKAVFAILFLCSVAGSQVKTVQQSSKRSCDQEARYQKAVAEVWESAYRELSHWVDLQNQCLRGIIETSKENAACVEQRTLEAKMAARAGAQPTATGKPAAEKPVTVTGICEQNCKVGEASR